MSEEDDEDGGASETESNRSSFTEGHVGYGSVELQCPQSPTSRGHEVKYGNEGEKAWMGPFKGDVAKVETALSELIVMLKSPDKVDTDEVDRRLHLLMAHADSTRRHALLAIPLHGKNKDRMVEHLEILQEQVQKLAESQTIPKMIKRFKVVHNHLEHIHSHTERQKFRRWHVPEIRNRSFTEHDDDGTPVKVIKLPDRIPWATVAGIVADSAVDGLIIGLSYSSSHEAGLTMAIATCLEMGFTGFAFSATIKNSTSSTIKHAVIVLSAPLTMLLLGFAGGALGSALEEQAAVFVGCLAFCVVAILYLVTQELLAEAQESGGGAWYINIWLFIGLYGGILLMKIG